MGHFFHSIFLRNPLTKQSLKNPRYRKDLTVKRLVNSEGQMWKEIAHAGY
jgi:hypothetical protein